MSTDDLSNLFHSEEEVRRWRAENENASARLELAECKQRMNFLLSQSQPVGLLELDREKLRIVFAYIQTGRLPRDIAARVTKHGGLKSKRSKSPILRKNVLSGLLTFVQLTEDDRKRIYNEDYDAGCKTGRQLGLRDAAFIYETLPLWKRILKRWK